MERIVFHTECDEGHTLWSVPEEVTRDPFGRIDVPVSAVTGKRFTCGECRQLITVKEPDVRVDPLRPENFGEDA